MLRGLSRAPYRVTGQHARRASVRVFEIGVREIQEIRLRWRADVQVGSCSTRLRKLP